MIRYLGCETAREMLEAFRDGELPVVDQVAVESHLRWCTTCAARVDDLNLIGAAICIGSPAFANEDEDDALEIIQSDVLARIGAERDESWRTWVGELFEDRRLLWPALGASVAVFICLCGALSVLRLATEEHPDSLAAMIESLADPGSDRNPLRHDALMAVPRAIDDSVTFNHLRDDVTFAVATVVTREGKISEYELLDKHRVGSGEVEALLHAVRQQRFEPAQAASGRAVAVNMVWLFTSTTAEGDAQLEQLLKGGAQTHRVRTEVPRVPVPPAVEPPVKPQDEVPIRRSSNGLESTTA